MIYLIALIYHIFGIHTKRVDGLDDSVGEGKYKCIICRKVCNEE